jgi:chromosome segregation ATPase
MPTDETHEEDLAQSDQAATQSQPNVWEQRYNGLKGKLQEVQNQLAEAKVGFKDERGQWDAERAGWQQERETWASERKTLAEQGEQLRQALQGAEGMIGELTGKWSSLSAQAEAQGAQLARQEVILRYPQLITDPIVKLAQASQLAPEELEATLSALAANQQQLVKQAYQEAQAGATAPVSPATGPGSAKQEQTREAWQAALDALGKGDMALYGQRYGEYLASLDQSGQSLFSGPRTLSQPM